MLAAAILSGVLAAGPSVTLEWPEAACPTRPQLTRSLAGVGVAVREGSDAQAAQASVSGSRGGALWVLTLKAGGRLASREVAILDSCDAESATLAAVVERFVRPVWLRLERQRASSSSSSSPSPSSVEPIATSPAPPPEPLPPLPPTPDAEPSIPAPPIERAVPAAPAITLSAEAPAPVPLNWWVAAGGLASVDTSGRFIAGAEAGLRRKLLDRLALEVRAGWETPYRVTRAPGELTVQQVRGSLAVEGSPLGHNVWVDALVVVQGLFAQSSGYALDDAQRRVNAALGLGLAYRHTLGALALEVGVRELLFLRVQEFLIDGQVALTLPISVTSAYLGLAYGL